MQLAGESAGESACPTTGKSFACIGGTGFSLSTPVRAHFFSPSEGGVASKQGELGHIRGGFSPWYRPMPGLARGNLVRVTQEGIYAN
jgi:hypothetical protein